MDDILIPPIDGLSVAIVPGSFKGSISSCVVAEAMHQAVRSVFPHAKAAVLPLADGGEGTLGVFHRYSGGLLKSARVLNARETLVSAQWLSIGKKAIIETSQAVGLSLVSAELRDPWHSTSFGVGQLIKEALNSGADTIYVGMGDSATMDVGMGMLAALGVLFRGCTGNILLPTVANMAHVTHIDTTGLDARIARVQLIGLADTTNSLCGQTGHCEIYGLQKGLRSEDNATLTNSFASFGAVLESQFGTSIRQAAFTSASGGCAAAFKSVLRGDLVHTLEHLDSVTSFKNVIADSSVVLTGEGRFDESSLFGKVPYMVAQSAKNVCLMILGDYTSHVVDCMEIPGKMSMFCLPTNKSTGHAITPFEAVTLTTTAALRLLRAGMEFQANRS